MKIFLDDLRNPIEKDFVVVRNYNDFIKLVGDQKEIDCISFDHDLGEERTGYDCICYVEEQVYFRRLKVKEVVIHTANPSVKLKMRAAARKITNQVSFKSFI
jgi:hypothetical protein